MSSGILLSVLNTAIVAVVGAHGQSLNKVMFLVAVSPSVVYTGARGSAGFDLQSGGTRDQLHLPAQRGVL